MRHLINFGFCCLIFFAVLSCQSNNANNNDKRQALLDSIHALEIDLHSDIELDMEKAQRMIAMYLNFSNQYRNDSLSSEYLFRASEIAMNIDRPIDACSYLYRIESQYEVFDKMPAVYYLLGFVNQNMLGDFNNAKAYYQKFLEKYPDHARADEVSIVLDDIELDDLDLVRKFEEQNAVD